MVAVWDLILSWRERKEEVVATGAEEEDDENEDKDEEEAAAMEEAAEGSEWISGELLVSEWLLSFLEEDEFFFIVTLNNFV